MAQHVEIRKSGNGQEPLFTAADPGIVQAVAGSTDTLIGAVTETAPATDTASSGLNGRLQRIAQRITSLIALVPAALTALGNFKVAVGESGLGFSSTQTFTPAAAAYGAADIMDVCKAFTFANAVSAAMPTGSLFRILTATIKIDVTSVPAGQTSYTLHLYSVTQPSAQADNDAWTLASGDLASYLGSISLGTPADKGAALHNKQQYVDYDVRFAGATIFGVLVTDGAHTAAAVARSVSLHGVVL